MHEHGASLLVLEPLAIELAHPPERKFGQRQRVVGGKGQPDGRAVEVLRHVLEGIGLQEYVHSSRQAFLAAQLLGGTAHVGGHRLAELLLLGDGLAEATARHDLLLGRGQELQTQAGHATQLLHDALDHDAEALADGLGVSTLQVGNAADAQRCELLLEASADAPNVSDGNLLQPGPLLGRPQGIQVEDPAILRVLLGDPVGQLGPGLGAGDADADGQARPLLDPLPDRNAMLVEVGDPRKVHEAFVDLKERRTAMDMTSAQTFRYSISDVGCP